MRCLRYENEDDDNDDDDDARSETPSGTRWRSSSVPVQKRRITFTGYAKILRMILARYTLICEQVRDEKRDDQLADLVLPSSEDWRHRVYYRLVELQRECNGELGTKRLFAGNHAATNHEPPSSTKSNINAIPDSLIFPSLCSFHCMLC